MARNGQFRRTRVCPLLNQSGQRLVLARDSLSANDPKRTSSPYDNGLPCRLPYSGNVLDFRSVLIGGGTGPFRSSVVPFETTSGPFSA
jgi:hypothetical protein